MSEQIEQLRAERDALAAENARLRDELSSQNVILTAYKCSYELAEAEIARLRDELAK